MSQPLSLSSTIIPVILPIVMATAHAIHEQDGTQAALSCLLVGDFNDALMAQHSSLVSEAIFSPYNVMSLADFREQGFVVRYDLAVMVVNPTATLAEFSDILVSCRDLMARHCLIFAPSGQNLTAFGFAKMAVGNEIAPNLVLETIDYTVWQFNLYDYKPLPDWFDSRFWANPENWNKFRW